MLCLRPGGDPDPHPAGRAIASASLNITIIYPTLPSALWVAELNGASAQVVTALKPAHNVTAYTPQSSGTFQLQVMGEWTPEQIVSFVFTLTVQP